jgi:hypothetical protein
MKLPKFHPDFDVTVVPQPKSTASPYQVPNKTYKKQKLPEKSFQGRLPAILAIQTAPESLLVGNFR